MGGESSSDIALLHINCNWTEGAQNLKGNNCPGFFSNMLSFRALFSAEYDLITRVPYCASINDDADSLYKV